MFNDISIRLPSRGLLNILLVDSLAVNLGLRLDSFRGVGKGVPSGEFGRGESRGLIAIFSDSVTDDTLPR